ncbi:PAS domain-containing protein [Leptolyngbya sp. FACHB-8]|nr:PAS domain-containing protein [Leptolyngbya sp. FACHB-8]
MDVGEVSSELLPEFMPSSSNIPQTELQPLLAIALNQIPQAVYIKDDRHCLVWANNAFCEFVEKKLEALLQQPDFEILKPAHGVIPATEALQPSSPSPTTPPIRCPEERAICKSNGELRIVTLNTTPLPDTARPCWLVSLTDITQQKLQERALERLTYLSETISQAVNEGLWEIEVSAKRPTHAYYEIWWSQQFRSLLGYSDETDFPNGLDSWIQIIHPDDREWVLTELQAHLGDRTGQTSFDAEYRMFTKTGEIRWFRSIGRAVPAAPNAPWRTIGILRDTTERKLAEAETRQQQRILLSVLENIPHRVWLQDKAGRYLAANQAFCQIWQKTPETLIGRFNHQIVPPEQLEKFHQEDEAILTTGEPLTLEEEVMIASGETRWFSTSKTPLRDEAGHIIGITGISMDITVRKQAEEDIQRINEELEKRVEQRTAALAKLVSKLQFEVSDRQKAEAALRQSEAELRQQAMDLEQALQQLQNTQAQLVQSEKMSSLGQLVAGIAHEINNPINFVYGNLLHASNYTRDLLQLVKLYRSFYPTPPKEIMTLANQMDLDFVMGDLPKLVSSMRLGAERIQKIVMSLRNFSRMDEAEFKAVNLHEGLESTLLILQNRIKPRPSFPGVELQREYGELPLVECYASQLNQVFMNILSNAIDALEEAVESRAEEGNAFIPQIRIQTGICRENWVAIAISDNGLGIPETLQSRIFDPFFTTKPVGQGTGLGMSISYQIVTERHGGRLVCESEQGDGTTFRVEIPIKQ